MPLTVVFIAALSLSAPPPVSAGRRVVGGQEVESNPNWGRSFAVVTRFGIPYGRGGGGTTFAKPRPEQSGSPRSGLAYGRAPLVSAAPRPRPPELRTKFLMNKFSVNPWTFQITPTHDLWYQQPFPVR